MNMKKLILLITPLILLGCNNNQKIGNSDDVIRRVENCKCYLSVEGQQLKPWELSWDEPEKLRKQFSHCVCETDIDLKLVKDPKRYIVPGSIVK